MLTNTKAILISLIHTLIIIISLSAQAAQAQIYDVRIPPGSNYNEASFRLWLPDSSESIRAVLVLVPGSNGDGRDQVATQLWQRLAKDQGLALVGLYMTDKAHADMFIEHYVDVAGGSGDALLQALAELGSLSGHPEIDTAPLLLWGMSAGGEFNYEFALWKPERVAAFVVNKGGIYYSALAAKTARSVPGLFFIGSEDMAFRNDIIRGVFSINRRAGALWALVEQPGVAHAVAGSDQIAAQYFKDVLDLRMGDPRDPAELHELALPGGWYCDPTPMTCEEAAGATPPKTPVSWLPSESSAAAWRQANSVAPGN